MATLVLGGIGAAAGSLAGGFGVAQGAQWGMMLGSLLDNTLLAPRPPDSSRLQDLRYGGSSYGAAIPRGWGAYRVPGTVVWAAEDEDGNHLVPHERSAGGGSAGGGKGPSITSYTATFMVLASAGGAWARSQDDPLYEELLHRGGTITRIWADDLLVYDRTSGTPKGDLKEVATIYDGTLIQPVNPMMFAKLGGRASAMRGWRGFAVDDMDLEPFGNRIPNFSVEVTTGAVTVATVFSDLCRSVGLAPSQIDATAGSGIPVTGFVQGGAQGPEEAVKALCTAYALDLVEVDGKLRLVPLTSGVLGRVPYEDLGAGGGRRLSRRLTDAADLPGRITVNYYDAADSHQQATATEVRQTSGAGDEETVSLPMSLTGLEARRIAARLVDRPWIEGESDSLAAMPRWLWLAPGDVLEIGADEGGTDVKTIRLQTVSPAMPGEVRLEGVRHAPETISQDVVAAGEAPLPPIVAASVPTVFTAWSGREVQDGDEGSAGFYVAAAGSARGWSGCGVAWSSDGGTSWTRGPTITRATTFGAATSALSASATPGAFDDANTVGVSVGTTGALRSVTDAQLLAGANLAVLGSELVGVGTATLTAPGVYTLSHLRRGERGTPLPGHASGERFVLVGSGVARVAVPAELVGETVLVKCLSRYEDLSDVVAQSVVIAPPSASALDALAGAVTRPTYVAEVVVLSGTGAGGWTTVDLTALGVPVGAREVTLVSAGSANSTGGSDRRVWARAAAGAVETTILDVRGSAAGTGAAGQARVPVSETGSVDILTAGGLATWSVSLQAYWSPVA